MNFAIILVLTQKEERGFRIMKKFSVAIVASTVLLGVFGFTGCGGSSGEPQVKPLESSSYFVYDEDHKGAVVKVYMVDDSIRYDDTGVDYEIGLRGVRIEAPGCVVVDDGFPESVDLTNIGSSGQTLEGKTTFENPCYADRIYFKADKVLVEKDADTGEILEKKITPITIEIPEKGGSSFDNGAKRIVISPAGLQWEEESGMYVLKTKVVVQGGVPGTKVIVGGGFPKLLPGINPDNPPKAMFLTETPDVIYDKGSTSPDRGTITYYGSKAIFSAGGFYDISIAVPNRDRIVILPSPTRRMEHYLGSYPVKDVLDGERLLLEGFPSKPKETMDINKLKSACGCETADGLGSLPFALVAPSRFDPYNGTMATLAVKGMSGTAEVSSDSPWSFVINSNGETDFDLYMPNFAMGKEVILWADYYDPITKTRYSNVFANTIIDSIEQPSAMSCSNGGGCRFNLNLTWSGSKKYVSYSNVVIECLAENAESWKITPETNLIAPGLYHTPGDGSIGFYVKPKVTKDQSGKEKVETASLTCTVSPAKEYLF